MKTKVCSKCKIEQDVSCFYKNKSKKDGFGDWCKNCTRLYQKQWEKDNVLRLKKHKKQYYKNNVVQINKQIKQHNKKNALFENCFKRLEVFEKVRQCPDNIELLEVKCTYCGKWLIPTNLQVKRRIQVFNGTITGEQRFYCSGACKRACPTFNQRKYWKGQIENRLGTSREVDAWFRQYVIEMDNWTCQLCGSSKKENLELVLHVHHVKGVAQQPLLQNDIDNAVTLCIDCHKEVHKNKGCSYFDLRRPECKV